MPHWVVPVTDQLARIKKLDAALANRAHTLKAIAITELMAKSLPFI